MFYHSTHILVIFHTQEENVQPLQWGFTGNPSEWVKHKTVYPMSCLEILVSLSIKGNYFYRWANLTPTKSLLLHYKFHLSCVLIGRGNKAQFTNGFNVLYCWVNTATITCATTTRCAIFEKMPLPSVTLDLIQISGQDNSLSPSWRQQSLVSILHLAAFFSVLQDLLKCVYVNSHFFDQGLFASGVDGGRVLFCCFTVIIY